ncbi:hypothetical protein B5M47_02915 [candidate division CPR3 bacterium 4484_211]|uniref:Uncharacterized protein n=1 Tax=candidate division CPR3 bacterium 4484_211 TaxID=1968527 RepID=A0A1W9NXE9_UNCC3|nr:MAG: hypothetical protein B5M47_02915 [candidate division CPR3 bacterium 4484_211]
MEIDVLTGSNNWWTTSKVPSAFLGKFQRPLLEKLKKYLKKRQALLVFGLRRVGKTTLFYQLIQYLLDKKISPLEIFYFSFDERIAGIEDLIKTYEQKVLKKNLTEIKRVYFFFDEIQKLKDWQNKIKILYDRYPNIKIFLTGSASVLLQRKSQESLAGRVFDFFLKPLSFSEFLEWKEVQFSPKNLELYQRKLMPLFLDYLRKGGFPEIVEEKEDEVIRKYIKNTVLERIVFKDLPLEFGLKDIELLQVLIEMIARNPGMIVNFDRLSCDLKRSKVTIINYFEYLKHGLVIREVKNLRPGFLITSRKAKKVYPTNTAFCFAYREDFYQDEILQKVAEVAVAEFLDARFYFRNNFEVDFVLKKEGEVVPIEVKYGKIDKKQITKFLEKFKIKKGLIVSKDVFVQKESLKIIPLWQFLLK